MARHAAGNSGDNILSHQIDDISGENLQSNTLGMKPAGDVFCYPKRETSSTSMPMLVVKNLVNFTDFVVLRKADSAIVDPTEKLMAMRTGRTVEVLDVQASCRRLSEVESNVPKRERSVIESRQSTVNTVTIGIDVLFWKWISAKQIAMVTKDAVYHWTAEDDSSAPVKIFDRHLRLAGYQIFDYRTDAKLDRLLLTGHRVESSRVVGTMQLYSVVNQQCERVFKGQVGVFAQITLEGDPNSTTCLCYTVTTHEQKGELHVRQVGIPPEGTQLFRLKTDLPPMENADFPIGIEFSPGGLIYVMTKFGCVLVYDLESGTCLYYLNVKKNKKTLNILFTIAREPGILAVDQEGWVLSLCVDENLAINHVKTTLQNPTLAMMLAERNNWPGCEELFVEKFNSFWLNGQFTNAASVAATAPQSILRTPDTIRRLKEAGLGLQDNQISPIGQYLSTLWRHGIKLNRMEKAEQLLLFYQAGQQHAMRSHHPPQQ